MKIQIKKTCILKNLNSPNDASGLWMSMNASIKITSHLPPSLLIFSMSFSSAETERGKSAQRVLEILPKITFKITLRRKLITKLEYRLRFSCCCVFFFACQDKKLSIANQYTWAVIRMYCLAQNAAYSYIISIRQEIASHFNSDLHSGGSDMLRWLLVSVHPVKSIPKCFSLILTSFNLLLNSCFSNSSTQSASGLIPSSCCVSASWMFSDCFLPPSHQSSGATLWLDLGYFCLSCQRRDICSCISESATEELHLHSQCAAWLRCLEICRPMWTELWCVSRRLLQKWPCTL